MSLIFDGEAAFFRCRRMWKRLGGMLEQAAFSQAKKGFNGAALDTARLAEACFWQATGEEDCITMKVIKPPRATPPASVNDGGEE